MSAWLDGALRRLNAPQALFFGFDLCANEAVANIVEHAFPDGGAHEIVLRLRSTGGALCLEIEDDGIAFNPLDQPPHRAPASLEDARIGGLGIELIRHYMHACDYARRDGRNLLTLMALSERPRT